MLRKETTLKKYIRRKSLIKYEKPLSAPVVKRRPFEKIEGFFTWPKLYSDMVDKFPDGSCFVELGVFKGRSMYYLLREIRNKDKNIKVYGIDHYKDMSRSFYKETLFNLSEFQNYQIICQDSILASRQFENDSIDFIFIDAGHTYGEVRLDILAWLPKVRKGGIMAGHDYNAFNRKGGYPGVNKAVNEIFGKRVIKKYIDEDCWIVKKYMNVSN